MFCEIFTRHAAVYWLGNVDLKPLDKTQYKLIFFLSLLLNHFKPECNVSPRDVTRCYKCLFQEKPK